MTVNFTTWKGITDGQRYEIPDSVVAYYDPREEAIGELTTVTDQEGGFDLTDSTVDVISDGINNNQTFRYDSSNVGMKNTEISVNTEPFAHILVAEVRATDVNQKIVDTPDQRREFTLNNLSEQDGDWRIFRGGSSRQGGTVDMEPHIYELIGDNTNEITLKIDGDVILSGPEDAGFIDGLIVGSTAEGFGAKADVDIGSHYVLDGYASGDLDTLRSQMADDWGITID